MKKAIVLTGGAFAALCLTPPVWAAPAALGLPFRVTSCANCRQEEPSVAGATSGAFFAAWEGSTASDARGVIGRLFTSAGTAQAADFAVAKQVIPDQYDAAVTRDSKGGYVAVWSQVAAGNSEILAQRFLASGTASGVSFKVNQDAVGGGIPADYDPAVAPTKDGGFVVAWVNLVPPTATSPGTNPQVMFRRFSPTGTPLGAQVKINTGLAHGDRPDVCVDTSGQAVVVWTSVDAFRPFQSNQKGISLRRTSPTGAPIGTTETQVAAPAATTAKGAVSCGAGSTFAVVWHSNLSPAVEDTDILGRRFSRLGRPVGPVFRVNSTATGFQKNPSISHDPQGRFVAVWQSDLGNKKGIHGRQFAANGTATGADFEVLLENDDSTPPWNPDVTHNGNAGNFVIVWQNGTQAIFGRRFKP